MVAPIHRFSRDAHSASAGLKFHVGGRPFELAGKVGDGAIGVVRRAVDLQTGNIFAAKFLAPETKYIDESSFEDIHARFRREGLRGASLDHDNLVKVYAYEDNTDASNFEGGAGPSNPFIIMEFVQGRTLESHIKKHQADGRLNVNRQTVHIGIAIASALNYLHDKAIVHRDVKPANIYLTRVAAEQVPSSVKLGDFGVVKWGDFRQSVTTGTLTMSGHLGLGTLKYMSPEQAIKPKEVTVRSDIFSLGITLYELFTGQILPSPHHVFDLMRLRYQRSGSTLGRLYDLGFGLVPIEFDSLFTVLFDCFLSAPASRPTSRRILSVLIGLARNLD